MGDNEEVGRLELLREQVQQHQIKIDEHTEILQRHTDQLSKIKETQRQHGEQIDDINANYIKLENVIYRENKETREMMRGTMDKQFSLIEALTGYKEASAVRDSEVNKLKIETRRDIFFKFVGYLSTATIAGGLLYDLFLK